MTNDALRDLSQTLKARTMAWWQAVEDAFPGGRGRRSLWSALITLVIAVLITLVWLAGRYEASQLQAELERDTADAVSDLRTQLSRHVQALQGLQSTLASAACSAPSRSRAPRTRPSCPRRSSRPR